MKSATTATGATGANAGNGTDNSNVTEDGTNGGYGGSGAGGGGAGIHVPSGRTLNLYGYGTLNATGENGGSGRNGDARKYVPDVNGDVASAAGKSGGNGSASAACGTINKQSTLTVNATAENDGWHVYLDEYNCQSSWNYSYKASDGDSGWSNNYSAGCGAAGVGGLAGAA